MSDNAAKILLLGKTGAGKSSFVNYFLGRNAAKTGDGMPVTQEITMYEIKDGEYPIQIFDTKGIEAAEAYIQADELLEYVKTRNGSEDIFDWFHTVFYCVSAVKRFEAFEADFIRRLQATLSQHIHIILTNCDAVNSNVISQMRSEIETALGSLDNIEIFEVVSINKKKRDGTMAQQKGKEEVSARVFDLFLRDIAYKVSLQYAPSLRKAYFDVAAEALVKFNKTVDDLSITKTLISAIKEDDADLEEMFADKEKYIEDAISKVQKDIDKEFTQIMKPIAQLYFSYKGIVTESFIKDAGMLFDDAFDWVDTEWIDNMSDDDVMKKLLPNSYKNLLLDKNGEYKDPDTFSEALKMIIIVVGDLIGIKSNLKKFIKGIYDNFILLIPSEEELQKKSFDRIIEVMEQER